MEVKSSTLQRAVANFTNSLLADFTGDGVQPTDGEVKDGVVDLDASGIPGQPGPRGLARLPSHGKLRQVA